MKGPGKTIKRRRREARTDYHKRMGLLSSGKPRIIVRKTNSRVIAQIVVSERAQDKVLISVSSIDLLAHGWPKELKGSLKSRVAAYLTGYLLGKKSKGKETMILDMGMQRNVKKSRIFAFLRGVIDAGVEIPHNKEVLPTDEDLAHNKKIFPLIAKLKQEIK